MRRLPHYLLAATMIAAAPLAALAVDTAPTTLSSASALPTSWDAVPVGERLQPWLAGELKTADPAKPLRVMVAGETTGAAANATKAVGLTVQQVWAKAGIVVAAGLPAQVKAVVSQPGVTAVQGDIPLAYTLETAHEATRSEQAMSTFTAADGSPVDGSGMSIAVIDSGIDGTHPMFTKDGVSKVVRNVKGVCGIPSIVEIFTGNQFSDACFQNVPTNDSDTISGGGHGTHVAGIAAGYEVTTTTGQALRGAAPGAKLVGLSVGAVIGMIDANSAINWVVEHQRRPCASSADQDGPIDPECPPIKVTNHSYGPATPAPEGTSYEGDDGPTVRLNRLLIDLGVTPVWAAGNAGGDGTFAQTNPPAMDATPGVLMVASYNDGGTGSRDNALSSFSSRGQAGDPTTYPDLSAPGDLITSACRPTLAVCQGAPSYDGGNYQTISGTSMASPYVAGVVAQLNEAAPTLTPGAIEDVLEDTAYKFAAGGPYESDPRNSDDTTSFDKGHGLVDVTAALAAVLGQSDPGEPTSGGISCPTDAAFTDAEGDATRVLVAETPLPSDPSLDVVRSHLSNDPVTFATTFTIGLADLTPPTAYGQYFDYNFTTSSGGYYLGATRSPVEGTSFSLGRFNENGLRQNLGTLTGAFDDAADEVRIVLPAAALTPALTEGSLISGLGITARRELVLVVPDVDSASGGCAFTVAGASSEPTGTATPTPTETVTPSETATPDPTPTTSGEGRPSKTPKPKPTKTR